MTSFRYGVFLLALPALVFGACGKHKTDGYQGYVEGDYVLLASPYAGTLQALNVARGQSVEKDAALFTLEQVNEAAEKREAEEKLRAAQARLENLRKGSRAPELDALLAEAAQAQAARRLSEEQYKRNKELFDSGFISSAGLDEAKANLARDRARAEQAQAQIRVAKQSVGRSGEIAGAQADIDAAKAVVAQADWKLAQKAQRAPQAALVQDTFFVQGEWVPAGKPVVSLLPPENIKVRFAASASRCSRPTSTTRSSSASSRRSAKRPSEPRSSGRSSPTRSSTRSSTTRWPRCSAAPRRRSSGTSAASTS
jgi:HlyD family secretion protein